MKYTPEQIRKLSLSADSIADMFAKYHEVLREELEHNNGRKISRRKIQSSVARTMLDSGHHLSEVSQAITAEGTLAAAGFTIVDDEPEQVQGWQPIETAPKDGTIVIGLVNGNYPEFIRFDDFPSIGVYEWRFAYRTSNTSDEITHWIPVPPLPENDK